MNRNPVANFRLRTLCALHAARHLAAVALLAALGACSGGSGPASR